jgi:hypothetical protein
MVALAAFGIIILSLSAMRFHKTLTTASEKEKQAERWKGFLVYVMGGGVHEPSLWGDWASRTPVVGTLEPLPFGSLALDLDGPDTVGDCSDVVQGNGATQRAKDKDVADVTERGTVTLPCPDRDVVLIPRLGVRVDGGWIASLPLKDLSTEHSA